MSLLRSSVATRSLRLLSKSNGSITRPRPTQIMWLGSPSETTPSSQVSGITWKVAWSSTEPSATNKAPSPRPTTSLAKSSSLCPNLCLNKTSQVRSQSHIRARWQATAQEPSCQSSVSSPPLLNMAPLVAVYALGTSLASPVTEGFYHVFVTGGDSTSDPPIIDLIVTILYRVVWHSPLNPGTS